MAYSEARNISIYYGREVIPVQSVPFLAPASQGFQPRFATLRRTKAGSSHCGNAFTAYKWFFMPALFFRSALSTQHSELSLEVAFNRKTSVERFQLQNALMRRNSSLRSAPRTFFLNLNHYMKIYKTNPFIDLRKTGDNLY